MKNFPFKIGKQEVATMNVIKVGSNICGEQKATTKTRKSP